MENLTVSPAVQKLVDTFYERYDYESLKAYPEIYKTIRGEYPNESRAMLYARTFAAFLARKPVKVYPFDILAGQIQHHNISALRPHQGDYGNFEPSLGLYKSGTNAYETVKKEIADCAPFWGELPPEDKAAVDFLAGGVKNGLFGRTNNGHAVSGFRQVLKIGYGGLLAKIEKKTRDASLAPAARDYLAAMRVAVEAARDYIRRYAQEARNAFAAAGNAGEAANLKRIAEGCENIAENPASGFYEAIQAVGFLQELVTMESQCGSLSFGRIDYMLYPFYKKDMEAGRITEDEAQELVDAWRVKTAGLFNGYQNATLGGSDAEGRFAGNDITLMILRSARKLRYDQPLLTMRCTKDMPAGYWEETVKLIENGDGFPALFNDDLIRASLLDAGVAKEDAWDYGFVGCVEPTTCGKDFSNTEQMRINWALILELMLNGGICRKSKEKIPLSKIIPLDEIKTCDELLAWYKDELVYVIRMAARASTIVDSAYYKAYPVPMLSSTIEGCIENAADAAGPGPVYRFSNINNTGMANVVDSFMAIKEVVFEKGMMSLRELNDALNADFEGYDDLLLYVTNKCKKFGNGDSAPEELMSNLVDFASDTITGIANGRGFHFRAGFYSVKWHAAMGVCTGAMPDGRKAAKSLANGYCPVQGADVKGPTAVINALTRKGHKKFANGMVLDLKFNPSFFKNNIHRAMLRPLVETYFDRGGMEMQLNVVSRETLLAARKDPEKYRNLIVRVSGFSAYFTTLDKTLQEEIIERTEYEHAENA